MVKDTDKAQMQSNANVPGPDVMLGLWASWMDRMADPAQTAGQGKPWWQMTTDASTPDVLAGGVRQLEEGLSKDPTLRSIDQMWNANPLREVTSSHFGFLGCGGVGWLGWGRLRRCSAGRARWRPSEGQGFQELGPGGEHNIGAQGLQVVEEAGSGSKRLAGVPPSA